MADSKNTSGYYHKILWEAVEALATGTGSIQVRLSHAAGFLGRLDPFKASFSDKFREELEAITFALTKAEARGDEGSVQATLRTMSDEEGSRIAGRILSLHTNLQGGI